MSEEDMPGGDWEATFLRDLDNIQRAYDTEGIDGVIKTCSAHATVYFERLEELKRDWSSIDKVGAALRDYVSNIMMPKIRERITQDEDEILFIRGGIETSLVMKAIAQQDRPKIQDVESFLKSLDLE